MFRTSFKKEIAKKSKIYNLGWGGKAPKTLPLNGFSRGAADPWTSRFVFLLHWYSPFRRMAFKRRWTAATGEFFESSLGHNY